MTELLGKVLQRGTHVHGDLNNSVQQGWQTYYTVTCYTADLGTFTIVQFNFTNKWVAMHVNIFRVRTRPQVSNKLHKLANSPDALGSPIAMFKIVRFGYRSKVSKISTPKWSSVLAVITSQFNRYLPRAWA